MRVLLLLFCGLLGEAFTFAMPAHSAPVVPNFTTGSMTSHTETTSKVTEKIVSESYGTGWEYSVSGTNIEPKNGAGLTPGTTSVKGWSALDIGNKPDWQLTQPGAAFQFVETYSGPGLSNVTTIDRITEIQQITDTISTFSQ
jgi:hypothetical protein|tara:strand:- start:449 stop:874 length:426 start_codon:yes stop_codon:yes gene_type:complete